VLFRSGGMVRAQMGEEIAPYEGRRILLDAEAFNAWLEAQRRRRSHPSQADCRKWLEGAMRQAPNRGSKSKREFDEGTEIIESQHQN
jgi:hypothetical protein